MFLLNLLGFVSDFHVTILNCICAYDFRLPVFIFGLPVLFRIFMSQVHILFLLLIWSCLFSILFSGAFEVAGGSLEQRPFPAPGFGRIVEDINCDAGVCLRVRWR